MVATIPESHVDMLKSPVYAVLSTTCANGEIQSTLVWVGFDGEYLSVGTKKGRVKEQNLRRDPRLTLTFVSTDNPWKYMTVRGKVVEFIEAGAEAHLDGLTQKYLGQPKYYGFVEPEEAKVGVERVILKIEPTKVMTVGQ